MPQPTRSVAAVLAPASVLAVAMLLAFVASSARALALPDGRGYELVSRVAERGAESALGGATPLFFSAAPTGETVDWGAVGACCGATSGGLDAYQAVRGADGWESRFIGPTPTEELSGLEALEEEPKFSSTDLSRTIFSTTMSYQPGDHRPAGSGGSDLYLREPSGTMRWLSQGPAGTGSGPYPTSFEGATADASTVVFSTAEALTANATALSPLPGAGYLYARDVTDETTSLIDVDSGGEPITSFGASLGDAGPAKEGLFDFGYRGSATHAISESGQKVFFETPPAGIEGLPEGVEPHLYMRDLASGSTTALDDPSKSGSARYQGASSDGSLVFFTSDEGLDGAPPVKELYEFDTTAHAIGAAPPMGSVALAAGSGVLGVTAMANDGSKLFFVATAVLAGNVDPLGRSASAGQPNLYEYDTATSETRFVATVAQPDVNACRPTCATSTAAGLIQPVDLFRPAYPSADGSVLVFTSSADLTGDSHTPSTTLEATALPGEHTIVVGDTTGFAVGQTVAIGTGEQEELDTVERVDDGSELTLSEFGPAFVDGLVDEHQTGDTVTVLDSEVYRYSAREGSLLCLSCTPVGVTSAGSASLGEVAGGSYGPERSVQMSEDGSHIFFDSPNPLLAGMAPAAVGKRVPPTNIYEWEPGGVRLIAAAAGSGAVFDGTDPSGNDAFFTSRAALVPAATAGSQHIYDARVGGGFPEAAAPLDPCAQEPCRPFKPAELQLTEPGSAGPGEAGPPPAPGQLCPVLQILRPTTAQLSRLPRGGRLSIAVRVSAPGPVLVVADLKLRGGYRRVASVSANAPRAGRLPLTLHVAPSGWAQLKGSKRTLRLEARYRASCPAVRLSLSVPGPSRRHG